MTKSRDCSMASAELGTVLHHLRRLTGEPVPAASDRELLEQFAREREQKAFARLVARHGPMVLALCRRVLGDAQDAEDAFQAVFLVLARRAGQINWQESVANWLYGVSLRVARKARLSAQTRQARERSSAQRREARDEPDAPLTELQAALDEELARLPTRYRQPLVLCHLQERTREEAAEALGCSEGAVRGLLYRGREMLRRRLEARGLGVPAALFAASLGGAGAKANVPASLSRSAVDLALGKPASTNVLTLAEGALHVMLLGKCKVIASMVVVAALLGVGGWVSSGATADGPKTSAPLLKTLATPAPLAAPAVDDEDEKEGKNQKGKKVRTIHGVLRAVDAAKSQIVAKYEEDDQDVEGTLEVPKDAKVSIAGTAAAVGELKKGMRFAIAFGADDKTVAAVDAKWPTVRSKLKGVDVAKGTLSVATGDNDDDAAAFDVTLAVGKDATILIGGLRAGLGDLKEGKAVELDVSADRKSVVRVSAKREKDEVFGTVKDVNPKTDRVTLTLRVSGPGEDEDGIATDVRFDAIPDVPVRIKGKDGHLKDLTAGMRVWFSLGEDRHTILAIRADDPAPPKKDDDD